jgi:hypothetical protein
VPNKLPTEFTLWLEFEEVDPGNWNIENDFCNVIVTLENGRKYALNVWTYQFLQSSITLDQESGDSLSGMYQIPPDLFVKELSRECLEQIIRDLLKKGDLEMVLNRSVGVAG